MPVSEPSGELARLAALLTFVFVSTISPGGATTMASASGTSFGFRRSIPLIVGIAAGLAAMGMASAVGLSNILLTLPFLQWAMKAAGSAYLAVLAWGIAKRGRPQPSATAARPTGLASGAWLVLHNPKGWAMTAAASTSFADIADGPLALGLLLGATFGTFALASLSLWCSAGTIVARALRTDRHWHWLNRALAALLIASVVPMWW